MAVPDDSSFGGRVRHAKIELPEPTSPHEWVAPDEKAWWSVVRHPDRIAAYVDNEYLTPTEARALGAALIAASYEVGDK
jgi:hypothetical protein